MVVVTPKFPLPKAYFDNQGPPLTPEQQEQYRATARERIAAVLQAERKHVRVAQRQVSSSQWKLLKKRKQVRIYKRRSPNANKPSMLGIGRMDGTLEDLIYGTYDKSYEEMKTTMSYVDIFTKDCNVLHNLELATPEDPFHYVGIKWALSQLPGKLFVKPRDWCYIEAMGITQDEDGKRYGYTIVHSVDVPNCPPFDPRAVVRGKGSLSFIYREADDEPGVVEIFAQGLFDPAGELIQYFSVIMTTEIFSGQALTVRCAEAKKLTILALRNYKGGKNHGHRGGREPIKKTCHLCVKTDSMFSSLKLCNICGATACDKCRFKRLIFMGENHSVCEVFCCKSCILDAGSMQVKPAEESFSMHSGDNCIPQELVQQSRTLTSNDGGSQQLHKVPGSSRNSNSISNSNGSYSSGATATSKTNRAKSISGSEFDQYDTSDDDQFSTFSSMDETDFEKMIEAMIDQRHFHNGTSRAGSHQLEFVAAAGVTEASSISSALTVQKSQTQVAVAGPVPMSVEEEQAAMFQKMVALQNAASQVYKITQANEEIMKKIG